jgi:hypothetical protein
VSGESSDRPDSGLRFETAPFQPDGGCPPLSLILLLLFGFPLALATGVFSSWALTPILNAANLIPEWTLFTIAIGLAFFVINAPLMLLVYFAVRWGKIRNPTIVTVVSVIFGVILIGSAVLIECVTRFGPGMQPLIMDEVVAYVAYSLAAAGTVAVMLYCRQTASKPFCTACNSWKTVHFQRRVYIPVNVLVPAVQRGDVVPLAEFDMRRDGPLTVTVTACPNCQLEVPAEVKVEQATTDSRGHTKNVTLAHVSYPGHAAVVLEEIFSPSARRGQAEETS